MERQQALCKQKEGQYLYLSTVRERCREVVVFGVACGHGALRHRVFRPRVIYSFTFHAKLL
jgi:hypothetical protein